MTQTPKSSFAKSQDVNPLNFLQDGETSESTKSGLLLIVKDVIEKGLSRQNGTLHFGINAKEVEQEKETLSLLDADDVNYMRHSNDGLLNAMGAFISAFQSSQMGPEKNQAIQWQLQGLDVQDELDKISQSHLKILELCLDNLYKSGLDKRIQPRRWDDCGSIGQTTPRICAQVSLAGKGLRI